MKTEKCPCNHCPYDCDDEENCAEYLQWSQKNRARQMSALTRKYNTALKRIEIQNSKLKELKKQCTKAKIYEWHYTKDEPIPKKEGVIYFLWFGGRHFGSGFYNNGTMWKLDDTSNCYSVTDIQAWTEIVFPKE